jgi:hypothetical protein
MGTGMKAATATATATAQPTGMTEGQHKGKEEEQVCHTTHSNCNAHHTLG